MNKANECTCPSGDGSLRWPCPAHPAVEQAGGDEHEPLPYWEPCNLGCDPEFNGKRSRHCAQLCHGARAALAQPSPAQAEAERPEVAEVAFVLRNIGAMDAEDIDGDNVDLRFEDAEGRDTGCDVSIVEYAEKAADLFEQHDRIVGELRAVITQLRQHKNDYMDAGRETYRALQNEIREREAEIARLDGLVSGRTAERDAALARVAELERQEPVATVAKVPGEDWNSLDFHRDLQDMQPGTKLYAAPVAQAQQLNDLDKQCRDDVARALGLRPNQERGFAWSYLLASIKSCVKASGDSAQAQHSVPETTNEEANSFLRVADAGQFKDNAAAVRTAAMIIRGLLHSPAIMKSIIRHRIGLTPEYEGQWHADLYGEDGEVQHHAEADTPDEAVRAVVALAAAPGKEGV